MRNGRTAAVLLSMLLAFGFLASAGCRGTGQSASSQPTKPAPKYKITWYRPNEPVKTFEVMNYFFVESTVRFIDPETGKECLISGTIRIDPL